MHVSLQRSVAALTAASLFAMPMTAMAQTYDAQVQVQVGPPPPVQIQVQQAAPPPPPDAVAPNGQYVAPMQQQTQQTYVPQSVARSGPRVIKDWQEGEPIPPGYHPSTRMRGGLVGGGIGTFTPAYLISIIIAAANADNGSANALWVPGLGPFIQMGQIGGSNCDASCRATADVGLVIDGLMQAGGIAMFIAGIAWPKTVLVRNDLGKIHVMPAPMIGQNTTGLGLVGTF